MRTARATCWLLVLAMLAPGCARLGGLTSPLPLVGAVTEPAFTASELHDALAGWASSFQARVVATCDRIRAATRERDPRRNCLLWQLRMVPLSKQAVFRLDPQEAYVAALALASAQLSYLTQGEGATLFGAQQELAIEAAREIEAQVFEIGRAFLTSRQLERLDAEVDALVARYPIRGTFAADALVTTFSEVTARQMFSWVVDLPMVPFRALSGVSDTAQAVHQFNETAQEFTETVRELPHLTRWQLELLLYDAEELESVDRALTAAESFAEGAERISGAAETLPAEFGAELAARLEEARATIAELDSALARAESLSGPLAHVSDRLGDASAQWTTLLREMRAEENGAEPGRPFDVREYESAAARIADASREVRALVVELNRLDASAAGALVDRALVGAALLIGVFFVALAGYRILTARLR
jgi:hypothetical protein